VNRSSTAPCWCCSPKKPGGFFSVDRFTKLADAARKKRGAGFGLLDAWLADAPPAIRRLLERNARASAPRCCPCCATPRHRDLPQPGPLLRPVLLRRHSVSEITHHDKARAEEWQRITGTQGEHVDVQCGVLLMVACGLEPARSLRKKDALPSGTPSAPPASTTAVARFIDNVVPFEYQADIRRMWDDDLGPEARSSSTATTKAGAGLPAGDLPRQLEEARLNPALRQTMTAPYPQDTLADKLAPPTTESRQQTGSATLLHGDCHGIFRPGPWRPDHPARQPAACQRPAARSPEAPPRRHHPHRPEPALSGPLAELGTELRDGAEAYLKWINSKGGIHGKKIELSATMTPTCPNARCRTSRSNSTTTRCWPSSASWAPPTTGP
jgi:hypothetical protein